MPNFELTRTGDRKLAFDGELIAESSSHHHEGPASSRWYELRLYRTDTGQFVLQTVYHTQWEGELDHASVYLYPTIEAVVAHLQELTFVGRSLGFPPGERFEQKRQHIVETLEARLKAAVTELLVAVEPERLPPPPGPAQ